ncbi:MAG: hypothetical protein LBG18_03060 [Mediterranea sp.]|jgi:hypothetical protein|nr:hypothetical protein [Mediterranea sp.]
MKRLFAACLAVLMWAPFCHAQDLEKEFEEFAKKQQSDFEAFRNKADAEFETFLREAWKKYEAFTPVPVPEHPEPPEPVTFDKTKPKLPPVEVKPGKPKIPEKPYTPVLVTAPTVRPGKPVRRTPVEFYGTVFEVATDVTDGLALSGNKEGNVADAWKKLCGRDYEQLVNDCMTVRKEKRLSDWAYLLLTKQIGVQLYGAEHTNEIVFLQMFLLNKSGFKVRLAKIDDRLKLLVAPAGTIYGVPYLNLNGDNYYVFEPDPHSSDKIYTYPENFADARNLICLNIEDVPAFEMEEQERALSPQGGDLKIQTAINKNLVDFYRDYPQCGVAVRYKTPMSEELRSSLYPQLKAAIAGKPEKDAADLLLNFVQTAFEYKTDGDQFGYEKPFFPDETFFYPYCDCEDRAMLYSTLVRDLLGLETVLLDYPGHIASAVRFTGDVPGDYIMLDDGGKFVICDPTYIGAPVGTCMDRYKTVAPEIIH